MQQPQGMARWPSGLGPPIVAGTMIGLAMVPEAPLHPKSEVVKAQTLNQEQNGGAGDVCKTKATMPGSATEEVELRDQRPVSNLIKQLTTIW
jgi:hypothetical protein